EDEPVAALDGAMRRDQASARSRGEARRHESGRARDEAVHDDRDPARGSAEDDAREPGDLEAAQLREHVERIVAHGTVDRDRARVASSRLMAGPIAKFLVPGPIARARISGEGGSGSRTPMSTTTTRAPACRARTLIAAPPRAKLSSICRVTSCG